MANANFFISEKVKKCYTRNGYQISFLGWNGNYANVTKNESVVAVYDDSKNMFMVESVTVMTCIYIFRWCIPIVESIIRATTPILDITGFYSFGT